MKLRIWTTLFLVTITQFAWGQTSTNPKLVDAGATAPEPFANNYAVLGATPEQEALVRAQIRIMQPDFYPLLFLFLPHFNHILTPHTFLLPFPPPHTHPY